MNPHQHLEHALTWRYATKRFDSTKKVPEKDWALLTDSLIKSPSSFGLQPWKFIIVQNPDVRKKLRAISWDQGQVTDCSHFVVFASKQSIDVKYIDDYINSIAKTRAIEATQLAGYRQMMIDNLIKGAASVNIIAWAQRQTYIALGFLLESAALLDIDTCPLEGLDPAAYDKILGLEDSDYKTVVAAAVGYRHAEDGYATLKKVRFPAEQVLSIV